MPFSIKHADILPISTTVAASVTALLAWKYKDRAIFDKNNPSVPLVKGAPLVGNLFSLIANGERFYDYLVELYEELDTLTFRTTQLFLPSLIYTADPKNVEHILKDNFEGYIKGSEFNKWMHDLLGNGIFNADGESWKVQRKTASRIFYVKNFRDQFTSVFLDEINFASKEIFDKASVSGEVINLHDIMLRFAMDSFAELAFGVKLNSLLKRTDFADSFDALQLHAFYRALIPCIDTYASIKHYFYFWSSEKSIKQHLDTVNRFAETVIADRRKELESEQAGEERGDLLSRFMKAKNVRGEAPNDVELRDTILNFLIAGRDTSANAISWALYQLIQYPDIQERVYREAEEYITEEVELDPPQLFTLIQDKMIYTHAMFFEVLRLFPSVPGNQKEAVKDDIWPDGTHIRKGDQISWQSYAQGRMTKIWGPDAKEFKPERWISPEGTLIRESPYKWSVFNAGPRICLGQNLAILESLIAILLMVKRYKFHLVPGHKVEILNLVTLSMKDGLKVTVEKRNAY